MGHARHPANAICRDRQWRIDPRNHGTVRDRASEYLPYDDQSWTTPDVPVPRGEHLPPFLFDEVMPLVSPLPHQHRPRYDRA